MNRLQALIELRDKVQAGDQDADIWRDIWRHYGVWDWKVAASARNAFKGSLDAAKALHEAVLPGWWWTVGTCRVSDDARVSPEGAESVAPGGREWSEITDIDQRPPGNPARAWLLAILNALIAQEQGK
jgi:hypothetical protein